MTCSEAEALLDNYSIPEGDPRLDDALAHVNTCAECRRKSEADAALADAASREFCRWIAEVPQRLDFFPGIKRWFADRFPSLIRSGRWPARRGRE